MQHCRVHVRRDREAAAYSLHNMNDYNSSSKGARKHILGQQPKVCLLHAACLLLLLAGPLEASGQEDTSNVKEGLQTARPMAALTTVQLPASLAAAAATSPAAASATTANLYTPNPPRLSRPSKAPNLPNNHPLKFAFHCLEGIGSFRHIAPASFTAYTEQSEVARLLPLELWQSIKQPPQKILTVVSTVTSERLDMLQEQCKSWPGPLSAVVYVPVVDASVQVPESGVLTDAQWDVVRPAYDAVQALFTEMESAANSCVLTAMLVYEHVQADMAHQLPINSMRNLGLLLARTPLVAMLDVDLLVSSTLAELLLNPPEAADILNRLLGQRAFMVIPAFDPPSAARTDVHTAARSNEQVVAQQQLVAQFASRSNKEVLQRLMDSRLLDIFNGQTNRQGHWETDFRTWFRCKSLQCPSYNIAPKSARFEPWGMLDRRMALDHPYDELYRGYGKNKIANLLLLRQQNFAMMVHGSGFLIHRPHEVSTAKKAWVAEFDMRRNPLNTVKLEKMRAAMQQGTYAPTLSPVTAVCISKHMDVGATVPEVSQAATVVKHTA